jgi:hydroxylamine reductase (hybrid-cluster protein)
VDKGGDSGLVDNGKKFKRLRRQDSSNDIYTGMEVWTVEENCDVPRGVVQSVADDIVTLNVDGYVETYEYSREYVFTDFLEASSAAKKQRRKNKKKKTK